ncbi:ABC transporter substrate-binding protein [Novosphingobium sp. BL-8A]|uniref:ABC transporter substrate-binding protein n=1 Tax=Novosphingobium sp. BL-8A TaxID=3127639 RepID=UPI003757735F
MRHPILTLGLVFSLAPVAVVAQTVDPARVTVQQLNDNLIKVMKGGGTLQARTAALSPVLDRAFDLPLMTRLAVGPSWTKLSAADQDALVRSFRRMTISQYARNFDSWSGESFTTDPQVQQRGGDRLVRTTLNVPKDAPVAISYRLRQSGSDWKIIDVFYRNAISQIATRRSDFASVLQKGGAASLVAHMDAIAAKGEKF